MRIFSIILMLCCSLPAGAQNSSVTNEIRAGMTKKQVRKALPRHNYFYRHHSYTVCEKPPWTWDQIDPMSYLICTYSNAQDRSGNIKDHDVVTDVEVVDFTDVAAVVADGMIEIQGATSHVSQAVWECVCLIHQSPRMDPIAFDPIALIQAVNRLRKYDKSTVVEALKCYAGMTMSFPCPDLRRFRLDDEERIFNICHVLFRSRKSAPKMPEHPGPAARPLVLVDDIPFYPWQSPPLFGSPPDPTDLIRFCEENCDLRKGPLAPRNSPIVAAERLCASHSLPDRNKEFVRTQALRCLRLPVYEDTDYRNSFDWKISATASGKDAADMFWKQYTKPLRERLVTWDPKAQRFVGPQGD